MLFFVSNNSVILSPGIDGVIPPVYVVRVRDLETNMDLDLAAARSSAAPAISSGTSSCGAISFGSYCTASCDSCDAAQLTIVQRLEAVLGRSLSHPERIRVQRLEAPSLHAVSDPERPPLVPPPSPLSVSSSPPPVHDEAVSDIGDSEAGEWI